MEAAQRHDNGNPSKPTNPFRKYDNVADTSRPVSPEPYSTPGNRKHTPVRAVFDDLTTAHSSITSGTARSRARTFSNNNSDPAEYDDPIPLQDLKSTKRGEGTSIPHDFPLPPLPATLHTTRYERGQDFLTDNDDIYAGQSASLAPPIQPSLLEPKQSMFSSIKNALVSVSSPSQALWPRSRQGSADFGQNPTFLDNQDKKDDFDYLDDFSNYHSSAGPVQYPPSTPGGAHNLNFRTTSNGYPMSYQRPSIPSSPPPLPMNTYPPHFSRLGSGGTEISLREGSTVGNIVQHYAGSESLDEDGSDFEQGPGRRDSKARAKNQFKPRVLGHDLASSPPLYEPLQLKKYRQVDKSRASYTQPPRFVFPQNQSASGPNSSSGYGRYRSSSIDNPYGSSITRNEPRTPQMQTAKDQNRNEFYDESTSDAANSTLPSLPRISYRNPFRPHQGRGNAARAEPDHCVYEDDPNQGSDPKPRVPLEREVSQALRRASGYSVYSVGSASSSVLDYGALLAYGNGEGPRTIGLQKGKEKEGVSNHPAGGHFVDVQAKGFYDEGAIPDNWITSRQNIRVPINHNGSFPDSPPDSPVEEPPHSSQRRSTEDNNDWETVGESAFGLEYGHDIENNLIGGGVHRTGSSIANTSDEGTASIHFEDIEEFGSTERIAQHPGNIQYSGDYRKRDLKQTKIPILMPVFNGHKVNGYLADSNRIRPPHAQIYYRPEPLTEEHKHPFNSTPPDVMPPARAAKGKGILRSYLAPPTSKAASSGRSNSQRDKVSTFRKPSFTGQNSRQASEWTDSYRQTGPSVSTQKHPFTDEDEDRPTSWQHVMSFASGGSVPGFRRDGSRIDPRRLKEKLSLKEILDDEDSIDTIPHTHDGKRSTTQIRVVPSSTRQPPGAFYQGLRQVSDQKRLNVPSQHDGAAKSTTRRSTLKAYGTTSLRPLSLRGDRLPSTPLRNVSNQSDVNQSDVVDFDDFVYRSPLAPPKRSTWQKLYSNTRLFELQQRAREDGVYSSQATVSGDQGLSRRHLYQPPTLATRPSNDSKDPSLRTWKLRFSVAVLVLCCFFPPLLILYALGKMDGIMVWWSDGEVSGFCKAQKKWAGILLCVEVFVIMILLIAFLAWFFGKHRH